MGLCAGKFTVGNFTWVYYALDMKACAQLASPYYHYLVCCTTDRCNAPDPKQDKVTKVVPGMTFMDKAPLP
jgi:hypothetical protein